MTSPSCSFLLFFFHFYLTMAESDKNYGPNSNDNNIANSNDNNIVMLSMLLKMMQKTNKTCPLKGC
jgi:hypothetical protein